MDVAREKQQRQVMAGEEDRRRSAPRLVDRLWDEHRRQQQQQQDRNVKDDSGTSQEKECWYPWGCDCGCSRQRDWSVTPSDGSDSGWDEEAL